MMNEEDFKVMVAPCKECSREFEMRIPIRFYDAVAAACEEDGETPVFVGRCPDCQERDPFLKFLKKLLKDRGIKTVGQYSRRIER
jgi:hypothetical protein